MDGLKLGGQAGTERTDDTLGVRAYICYQHLQFAMPYLFSFTSLHFKIHVQSVALFRSLSTYCMGIVILTRGFDWQLRLLATATFIMIINIIFRCHFHPCGSPLQSGRWVGRSVGLGDMGMDGWEGRYGYGWVHHVWAG